MYTYRRDGRERERQQRRREERKERNVTLNANEDISHSRRALGPEFEPTRIRGTLTRDVAFAFIARSRPVKTVDEPSGFRRAGGPKVKLHER